MAEAIYYIDPDNIMRSLYMGKFLTTLAIVAGLIVFETAAQAFLQRYINNSVIANYALGVAGYAAVGALYYYLLKAGDKLAVAAGDGPREHRARALLHPVGRQAVLLGRRLQSAALAAGGAPAGAQGAARGGTRA